MQRRGFTLIELLVVIAIIGLLSSVVMASLNTARAKARDSKRLADLHQIELALGAYYADTGSYPVTTSQWWGNCDITATWGSGNHPTSGANGWIPNLAPQYIPELPTDPKPSTNACYLYHSDGKNYSVLANTTVETYTADTNPRPRPSYPEAQTFAVYSSGASGW